MEIVREKKLIQKQGDKFVEVSARKVLKDIDIVGFFFAAYWCPPCRIFTPQLAKFYRVLKNENKPFEIIFVSADADDIIMYEYMKKFHENWLAVSAERSDKLGDVLSDYYASRGLPSLVIVRRNGFIVTKEGRWDVFNTPLNVYKQWSEGLSSPPRREKSTLSRFLCCK